MNKCGGQKAKDTTLIYNIGDNCKSTTDCITNCSGNSSSMSNGNDDSHDLPMNITDSIRYHIECRKCTVFNFFTETLLCYLKSELIICFNGGKDCTVLLHLLMLYCREHEINSRDIAILYIESDDSFPEIDEFVTYCEEYYNVRLIRYKDSLKAALTQMKEDMPQIKAVFVGSRNTDPYCENLQPVQRTDKDWPDIMRLNPLLEWSYHDIWYYIHMYKVAYCSLYDKGYTSIGYKSNTLPNPHLLYDAGSSDTATPCYKPAWELEDPKTERDGRVSRK